LDEPVRFVPTADVHRIKTRLPQNAGCQVTTLSHLTVDGDLLIVGQFAQPRA
jgi:hypothetical protein